MGFIHLIIFHSRLLFSDYLSVFIGLINEIIVMIWLDLNDEWLCEENQQKQPKMIVTNLE